MGAVLNHIKFLPSCITPNAMQNLQGLGVKAIRGDALLFYGLKPNGETDPASLHGSCPTLKGDKFSATKWVLL